jgi:epoxyqueuosine reductase
MLVILLTAKNSTINKLQLPDRRKYSELIKQKAIDLGFSACGIAFAQKLDEEEPRLRSYIERNFHGQMGYMANHFEKRLDPTLLVPGAKSVVVVLLNYFPSKFQEGKDAPIVSKYAYGMDYHIVLKNKLKLLYDWIDSELVPIKGRVFTDSAPVLERAWAVKAGLGWIGKNGLLLNRELGSFFFIGELILDLELEYDQPNATNYCGTCTKCLDACPTSAFVEPSVLDSRRCISYLTIELKEDIPEEVKPVLKNRIYGCDSCQDVCPWNRNPKPHSTEEFNTADAFISMNSDDWKQLDEETFNRIFRHSALERAGFSKLKMNVENVSRHLNINKI